MTNNTINANNPLSTCKMLKVLRGKIKHKLSMKLNIKLIFQKIQTR